MSIKIQPNIDEKFIGIPFVQNGRTFEGTDCLGLVYLWFKEHGVIITEAENVNGTVTGFWWVANPKRYLEGITQYGRTLSFSELKRHDLILFFSSAGHSAMPVEAGIMIDDRHYLWIGTRMKSEIKMLNLECREKFWGGLRPHLVAERGLK